MSTPLPPDTATCLFNYFVLAFRLCVAFSIFKVYKCHFLPFFPFKFYCGQPTNPHNPFNILLEQQPMQIAD